MEQVSDVGRLRMRKLGLAIIVVLVLLVGGGYLYLSTHQDVLSRHVADAVAKATGAPLVWEKAPTLSVYPKLGLEIGKARWGDPAKDPLALQLGGASVRVALLPLFEKRVEVEAIILNEPILTINDKNVQKAQNKELQAQSPEKGGSESAGASAATVAAIKVTLLQINKGQVVVQQKGQEWRLSAVQLELKDIEQGKKGRLQASMRVADLSQGLEADLNLKTALGFTNQELRLEGLDAQITPRKGLPLSEPLKILADMRVDVVMLSAAITKLHLATSGMKLDLDGSLSQHGGTLALSLSSAPRQLLANLGIAFDVRGPEALERFDMKGKATLSGTSLNFEDIVATLDASHIKGSAKLALPLSVQAKLFVDALHADKYLPKATPKTTPEAAPAPQSTGKNPAGSAGSGSKTPAVLPVLDISLNAGKVHYDKFVFSDVQAKLAGQGGKYALNPVSFKLYESLVALNLATDMQTHNTTISLNFKDMAIEPLLRDLAGKDSVKGLLSASMNYAFTGQDEQAVRKSLTGKGTIQGKAMTVRLGGMPPEWLKLVNNLQTLSVDSLLVGTEAKQGIIDLEPLQAKGPMLSTEGKGVIDLPKDSLDVRINAMVAAIPLPLAISGSLSKPSFGLRPMDAIKGVLDKVGSTSAESVKEGVKAITGGVKDTGKNIGKGVKDTAKSIKGLFKK